MLAPSRKLNRAQRGQSAKDDLTKKREGAVRFRTAPLEGGREKVSSADESHLLPLLSGTSWRARQESVKR